MKEIDETGEEIETKNKSRVWDLDDQIWNARALDDVLDRAVDFAISSGLRVICIDQQYLPRPKEGISSPKD